MIYVVDYGAGNINSVINIIKKVGGYAKATKLPEDLDKAEKIILPGVGSFDYGMNNLINSGFKDALDHNVINKGKQLLGICLGAQMLGNSSEEGQQKGLSYIDMKCKKFIPTDSYPVPHMGWNHLSLQKQSAFVRDISENSRFYFVHSYYMECQNIEDILSTTHYINNFVSAVQKDNVTGVQFHPEKSHMFGYQLFKNFLEL